MAAARCNRRNGYAAQAKYNREHPEAQRAARARYRQTERGKLVERAHRSKRRALIRGNGKADLSAADIQRIYKRQRGRCYNCRKALRGSYEVDHYTPLSRGGQHTRKNIVILCPPCNARKWNKLPHEHAAELGRLFF